MLSMLDESIEVNLQRKKQDVIQARRTISFCIKEAIIGLLAIHVLLVRWKQM